MLQSPAHTALQHSPRHCPHPSQKYLQQTSKQLLQIHLQNPSQQ